MKKAISILLILSMVLIVTACGNGGSGGSGGGKAAEEVGFWAYEDVMFDLDKMNEGLEDELKMTEEDVQSYVEFYSMFLGGMYFEFKDDGTGVIGYVTDEGADDSAVTTFKYADNKFTYESEEEGPSKYEIKDGKLLLEEEGVTLKFKKVASMDEIQSNYEELMKALEDMFSEGE